MLVVLIVWQCTCVRVEVEHGARAKVIRPLTIPIGMTSRFNFTQIGQRRYRDKIVAMSSAAEQA